MRSETVFETPRLLLRHWRPSDRDAFAAINCDPLVMEHFPALLDRADSDAFADRIGLALAAEGIGLWAVEIKGGASFIGFVGLSRPSWEAHFTPAVEVGWRLARAHWGQGFAPEAAAAALEIAFAGQGLEEVVSFTVPANLRSRRVMEKIGMHHDVADDFDHPELPEDSTLRRHVLYRKRRPSTAG